MRVMLKCQLCTGPACSINMPEVDHKLAFALEKMAAAIGAGDGLVAAMADPTALGLALGIRCADCAEVHGV